MGERHPPIVAAKQFLKDQPRLFMGRIRESPDGLQSLPIGGRFSVVNRCELGHSGFGFRIRLRGACKKRRCEEGRYEYIHAKFTPIIYITFQGSLCP